MAKKESVKWGFRVGPTLNPHATDSFFLVGFFVHLSIYIYVNPCFFYQALSEHIVPMSTMQSKSKLINKNTLQRYIYHAGIQACDGRPCIITNNTY